MLTVIPLNGTGERFKEAGYTTPKPFLPMQGKPLIEWVVDCLPDPLLFLPRREYVNDILWGIMKRRSAEMIVQDADTPGPLVTIHGAMQALDIDEEILVADSDSITDKKELLDAIQTFRDHHATGGVTVRMTSDPGCSYAKLSPDWWVQEIREKEVFTPWSTTGPYHFASGKELIGASYDALKDGIFSIAPIYNYITKTGGRVKAVPVFSFYHLGTPEAYEKYANDATQHTSRFR